MDYWASLNGDLKWIVDEVRREWLAIIDDPSTKEPRCQSFIQENAGLFFLDGMTHTLALSQVRLGADYITDFVVGSDQASLGYHYEIIEIESPNDALYTKAGIMSNSLATAVQQIQDWREWIDSHPNEAERILPSASSFIYGKLNIAYTIVIGRRSESAKLRTKRNRLARDLDVSIRSFDYLTDKLSVKLFWDALDLCSDECRNEIPMDMRNVIANPFQTAFADQAWRRMVSEGWMAAQHVTVANADLYAKHQVLSSRYGQFQQAWNALPQDKKDQYADGFVKWFGPPPYRETFSAKRRRYSRDDG